MELFNSLIGPFFIILGVVGIITGFLMIIKGRSN